MLQTKFCRVQSKIPSKLSSNAEAIFKALNISLERNVKDHVVAKFQKIRRFVLRTCSAKCQTREC